MSGYRLSVIRQKGWLRVGIIGAAAMFPYTAMEHALGRFSEGPVGYAQIAEYLSGGIAIWLIVGFGISWMLHGFAVRQKEDGEEETSRPRPGIPGAGSLHPTSHAAGNAAHGKTGH